MMAWVRTGVSLIGFGFTIVQFFDRMASVPGIAPARFPDAPHYLGLMLITCGIFALGTAVWQYRAGVRYLWAQPFTDIAGIGVEPRQTPLLAVVFALILVGLFTFFSVLFRLL